jgi:heme exporter protein D
MLSVIRVVMVMVSSHTNRNQTLRQEDRQISRKADRQTGRQIHI